MDELIQKIQVLTDTVALAIQRMEEAFKLLSERASDLQDATDSVRVTTERLEITNEALLKSLSENDQALTDLATITAALTAFRQAQEQQAGS